MKTSILLSLLLLSLIGIETTAQIPPSVAEQLCRPFFAGVQPKADAKTNIAVEASIKMQVKDKIEALPAEQVKSLVLTEFLKAGYKEEELEQYEMMPAMVVQMMVVSAAMQTSREDTMHWSGVANPFDDEAPPQEQAEKFGNQHPNYDPKKPFWQESEWRANNFKEPNGVFKFDYTMRLQVITPQGNRSFSIYLNSKDGSMGIDGREASFFNTSQREGEQTDFMVQSKSGRGVTFTTKGDTRNALLLEQQIKLADQVMGGIDQEAATNEAIIRELSKWDQLEPIAELDVRYPGAYKCFEGPVEGSDSDMELCFHRDDVDIITMVPNLGLGVGVFKDYVSERNLLVVRRKIQNKSFSLVFILESFDKKPFSFDGGDYEVFMGTEANVDNASYLKKRLEELEFQRRDLKDQKDAIAIPCKGDPNCLKPYTAQLQDLNRRIEAIEEEITELDAEFDRNFERRN
ncbi:MAG: hypothetical protein KDC34_11405 [Saprospiraceae bacterium]|nr:hypothetical protein [Saprospiraceae bacterium]